MILRLTKSSLNLFIYYLSSYSPYTAVPHIPLYIPNSTLDQQNVKLDSARWDVSQIYIHLGKSP